MSPSNWLLLTFFVSILVVPLLEYFLMRWKSKWVAVIVAFLMYIPSLLLMWLAIHEITRDVPVFSRWKYFYVLHTGAYLQLKWLAILAVLALVLFLGILFVAARASNPKRIERVSAIRIVLAFTVYWFLLLLLVVYFPKYKSLADSVSENEIALAKKRLAHNIEGVGPNNGYLVDTGSFHPRAFPLLPLAVENGSKEMVDLLIDHGADLNIDISLWSGVWESAYNPFYYAIKQEDISMTDHLIEKGADPTQALLPALRQGKVAIVKHLLEKGASLEKLKTLKIDDDRTQTLVDRMIEELGKK